MNPYILWTLIRKPRWLQLLTKSRASWPSSADVVDWRRNIPIESDDGAHFVDSPFYFEWWYFDATFDDGSALSVIVHLADLIKPASKEGSLNVAILDVKEPVRYLFVRYPIKDIQFSSERCDLKIGRSRCWLESDNTYRIYVEEEDIKMELSFRTTAMGWRPGNGRLDFGSHSSFSWVVPQPKAHVEGFITYQGIKKKVTGWGYHDHNWGTVPLLDAMNGWSWGRIYCNDYSIVFSDMHLSYRYGGGRVMPFAVLRGSEIVMSSFLKSNVSLDPERDFLRNPKGADFPLGWYIEGTDCSKRIELQCMTNNVLEKADLLSGRALRKFLIEKVFAHPFYLRCKVVARGEVKLQDELTALEGTGIYEQIIFR